MSSKEPDVIRRTPVIGVGPQPSVEPGPLNSHAVHAFTRRELMDLTPPTPMPAEPAEQVSPERARLPEPQEMGAIIGFQRSYDGGKTVYSYAAIKTPQGWYCTAVNFHPALTWVDLLAWIDAWPHEGDEQPAIWLAADWVEVQ